MSDTQTAERFLTVAKFVDETGYSDSAVRNKISKGVWLDGVHYVRAPDGKMQRNMWRLALRRCGIRHRPPKELRDSSVTFALQAGADPWYVARQHGHSLTMMMKDYAKWIPNADRNRNRNAINTALAAPVQKEGTNDNTNET